MTSTIVKSLSRNGGNERPLFDLQRLKPATARPPGWGGHWHGGGWGGGGPGYWGAGLIGLGVGAAVGRCRGVRASGLDARLVHPIAPSATAASIRIPVTSQAMTASPISANRA